MKGSGTGRPLWRETRFCQAFLSFESENPFLTAESAARLSNSCEQIFQPRKVRHHRQKEIEPALALGLEDFTYRAHRRRCSWGFDLLFRLGANLRYEAGRRNAGAQHRLRC